MYYALYRLSKKQKQIAVVFLDIKNEIEVMEGLFVLSMVYGKIIIKNVLLSINSRGRFCMQCLYSECVMQHPKGITVHICKLKLSIAYR